MHRCAMAFSQRAFTAWCPCLKNLSAILTLLKCGHEAKIFTQCLHGSFLLERCCTIHRPSVRPPKRVMSQPLSRRGYHCVSGIDPAIWCDVAHVGDLLRRPRAGITVSMPSQIRSSSSISDHRVDSSLKLARTVNCQLHPPTDSHALPYILFSHSDAVLSHGNKHSRNRCSRRTLRCRSSVIRSAPPIHCPLPDAHARLPHAKSLPKRECQQRVSPSLPSSLANPP